MARARNSRHTVTHLPRLRARETSSLTMLRNCETGESYRVHQHQARVVIGGASHCDIVICDPYASASHCTLQRMQGNAWQLRDHGSKNGTRINGTRVAVAELRPGSQIAIGDTCLELLNAGNSGQSARDSLVGSAPAFLRAIDKALKAARTRCSILILGETGTGKELLARAIHEASRRAEQNFVPVNCGSIPDQLVRSELFGHMKGSFTGATADHKGHFRQAHQGTIFLDEIGELPLEQQPHLLRALETGLIRRVGSPLEELIDSRVVAATNRSCLDPRHSPLREDLFHRLSAIVIELPPLRERKQDIALLIQRFLLEGQDEYGPHIVSAQTLKRLSDHEWKGNVRELRNSVLRAMALGSAHLELRDFLPKGIRRAPSPPPCADASPTPAPSKLTSYQRNQRSLIAEAYGRCGSIRAAAEELGIPKSTLADLCKSLRINTSRGPKKPR